VFVGKINTNFVGANELCWDKRYTSRNPIWGRILQSG